MPDGKGRTVTRTEEVEFVEDFLQKSDSMREEYREVDREVLENYMVLPYHENRFTPSNTNSNTGSVVLKDTETHQVVETHLAKMLMMTLGEDGFINAQPVGREDAFQASTMNRLLERTWRTSGNFRSQYVTWKDMLLFGVGLQAPAWVYQEGWKPQRIVNVDPLTGEERVDETKVYSVLKDDIDLVPVDLDDFFPDPGGDTIANMQCAGRRFVIPAWQAQIKADSGMWDKEGVKRAIAAGPMRKDASGYTEMERTSIDRPNDREYHPEYKSLVGYELWGWMPFNYKDGIRNRRITILNGEWVASDGAPHGMTRHIPIYEHVVNPIQGTFRGVSPGATSRFTQSFTDALLACLAWAVMRKTTPPVIYDKHAQIDLARLKAWTGPIGSLNIDGVKEMNYNPPLQEAFMMLAGLKDQMRNSSGATGGMQGLGLGSKRFSATEAQQTFMQADDRPTMMATLLEREYLPEMGKGLLELYQQFIASSEDLQMRVGEDRVNGGMPYLEDIQGDFDIKFVGTSQSQTKEVRLQFIERAFQVFGSIPGAAPLFPWQQAMKRWLEMADLRELESMVAAQTGVEDFVTLQMMQSGQNAAAGNGNNAGASTSPAGLMPAQSAGQAL